MSHEPTWEKEGFLFGSLTEEDCDKGGIWLIGDQLPEDHPGHSEAFMYKSWVAKPKKYAAGKYKFIDRVGRGLYEYVMVMRGTLQCLEKFPNGRTGCIDLVQGTVVDLPPDSLRAWRLPEGVSEARGLTILRSEEGINVPDVLWVRYGMVEQEFLNESWGPTTSGHLMRNHGLEIFQMRYVEVFRGELSMSIATSSKILHQTLREGDHVYHRSELKVTFTLRTPETYGTVVTY